MITLECTVYSNLPLTDVYWTKYANGMKTIISAGRSGITGSTLDVPSLTILNATLTDSGDYACVVKNGIGIGKSKISKLTVYGGLFFFLLRKLQIFQNITVYIKMIGYQGYRKLS